MQEDLLLRNRPAAQNTAAAALREFAEQIPTDIPGFGDLESVDMDEVDWVSMIREELESFDYESGRA